MELVKFYNGYKYISTKNIIDDCYNLLQYIEDCYCIIGISRSGLIPASILSVLTNNMLYSIDLKNGTVIDLKSGMRTSKMFDNKINNKNIYIVDDSCYSGRAMTHAYKAVSKHFPGFNIKKIVLYSTYNAYESKCIDHTSCVLDFHFFEWNMFSSPMTPCLTIDFDGILCRDFLPYEDDDGEKYRNALLNMKLKNVRPQSRFPISIVTARLEKYRNITQQWLHNNNINYDQLIMGPWNNISERHNDDISKWKASIYSNMTNKLLFVESDLNQAINIFQYSKKPVLHYESGQIFQMTS